MKLTDTERTFNKKYNTIMLLTEAYDKLHAMVSAEKVPQSVVDAQFRKIDKLIERLGKYHGDHMRALAKMKK